MFTSVTKRAGDFFLRPKTNLPVEFPFGLKRGSKLYLKSLFYFIIGSLLPVGLFMGLLYASVYLPFSLGELLLAPQNQGLTLALVSAASFICGFGMQVSVFRTALHSEGKRLRDTLGLNLEGVGGSVWKAIGLGLLTAMIGLGLEQLIELVYAAPPADPTADFMGLLKGTGFLVMAGIALLAPVMEEIIFRGFIFRMARANLRAAAAFSNRPGLADWLAIGLSALIFGLMHMNFAALPFYIALGAVFAESYRRTGCLYVPMVAHFVNNALVVLVLLLK